MPLYKSNLLLNLTVQTASSADSTENFSEELSQEIYEAIEEHLQETVDEYNISTELLTTELVSVAPEYTPLVSSHQQSDYISLQSLYTDTQGAPSAYTPLVG